MQPSLEASPRFPGHRAVSGEHSQGLRGQRGGPLADCSDYGGGAANGPMERYSDWMSRVDTILSLNQSVLNTQKIRGLIIHTEANNACIPVATIAEIAQYVKSGSFYSIGNAVPLAVGYPMTIQKEPGEDEPFVEAKDLPNAFPEHIELIGTWDYGIFNPNNPTASLNATTTWASRWNTFKSKLGTRKAVIVLNAFCNQNAIDQGWVPSCTSTYTCKWNPLADNWRIWAATQSKVVGMIAFLWHGPSSPTNSGTEGMAQTVRNAHQEIIDAINYNNP